MIRIEALFKDFPKKKNILNGLNLTVENNEIVTILGANGSGKTTLLKLVSGLILPTSGRITIDNHKIKNEEIGYLNPSNEGLFSRLTGKENLTLFGKLLRLKQKEISQTIDYWSDLPAFKEALSTPFCACSSGMKSTLLLCKAMLHSPKLLLLDEPYTNLDQVSSAFISDTLRTFAKEGTILLTGHIEQEYQSLSPRKVRLMGGQLV